MPDRRYHGHRRGRPRAAVAEVAREHGAWLHVDAAWAGVAAVCPEHRWLNDGVEHADSSSPTRTSGCSRPSTQCVLGPRPVGAGRRVVDPPEYLRNPASESGAVVDYRDWQPPLGRRFRALKLWTVLRHGLAGLRDHMRGHVALAAGLADRVAAEPGFALAAPPSLALVCLRCDTGDPDADDRATRALLGAVNASGRAFVTHTVVDGRYAIRVAIGGVTTGAAEVNALWDMLRSTAAALNAAPSDRVAG